MKTKKQQLIAGLTDKLNSQAIEIERLNDIIIGYVSRLSTQGESIAEFRRENEKLRMEIKQLKSKKSRTEDACPLTEIRIEFK